MNPHVPLCAMLLAGSALAAESSPTRSAAEPQHAKFVFSLLPKSLQRHPELDFHVITEMTADGKKAPTPSAERPVYYIAQAGQFTQLGHNTPANEHPPSVGDLTRAMQRALASSGFQPATPATALPAIAIVFNFGSFARFSTDAYDFQQSVALQQMFQDADPSEPAGTFLLSSNDRDADALLPIVLSSPPDRTDVLQRADLIGGTKFARELADVINQEATYQQSRPNQLLPVATDASSPFHQFMASNPKTMALIEESFSSCYFVTASAYDYIAMKGGRRVLLWRTKMTVNSSGISMTESLPELVLTAGPYLGREMTEAVTVTRKISREGKVEVGTPRVIDYSTPDTLPAAKAVERGVAPVGDK